MGGSAIGSLCDAETASLLKHRGLAQIPGEEVYRLSVYIVARMSASTYLKGKRQKHQASG